jgi:hypothetical protein
VRGLALALVGCARPVDVGVELPDGASIVVSETRSNLTRTPEGGEQIDVTATTVWIVEQGGRFGVDEVSWREEVATWEIRWEGLPGVYTWNLQSVDPVPEPLRPYAPPLSRTVWVAADGSMSARATPQASNESAEQAPSERRAVDRVPSWLAAMALVPREGVKAGQSWSQSVQRGDPSMPATVGTTWTLRTVAGTQAVIDEAVALEASPPPASGTYQTTSLTGAGDLRIDVAEHVPVRYESQFEANIASPSARGTATLRSNVTFEVR